MRRSLIIVFALLAFFPLPHAQAQQEKTGDQATRSQDQQTESRPRTNDETALAEESEEADEEADEEAQDSDENFIPTEKINVDSSVSFPVDI